MKKTEARRQILIEKIADHLLLQGMSKTSLRQLAKVVGTSDRMLLYYFKDKEALLTAALGLVSNRLEEILKHAPLEQVPFQVLLPTLAGMIKNPLIRPYLKLWLELTALSAGGEPSYRKVTQQIYDRFFSWIASGLQVEKEEHRAPVSALALATLEGFVVLDAIGYDSQIKAALEGVVRL